ncbi:terminase small subunit [Segnochrobactraceae bacterium EtOH-i3]
MGSPPATVDALIAALPPRQGQFVREYLVDLNATQAAIRAGYSPKTAGGQGFDLLKKPKIQEAITAARAETATRLDLSREDVLRQYQRIGFSDPRKFFREDGSLKAVHELDDDTAAAVQGFDVELRQAGEDEPPVPTVKVRWADRKVALDAIMKAQGWNEPDKHELAGKGGGPIQTETTTKIVLVPTKVPAEVSVTKIAREGADE